MDRAEATGFGIAFAGHAALLAALVLGLSTARLPVPKNDPIEVSFVEEVGLESQSPSQEEAATLRGGVEGPPEMAEPAVAEPLPVPPAPQVQPQPAPRVEPRPQPKVSPVPRREAPRPAPAAKAPPAQKASQRRSNAPAQKKASTSQAKSKAGTSPRPTGRLDGLDLGSDRPSQSKSANTPGATMSSQAAASIAQMIRRQVQPCANRTVSPGPGANKIRVTINLRLNPDGSLRASPRVIDRSGVTDDNRRYLARVEQLAIGVFTGCAPLRDLPANLHSVPNGWSDFDMIYNLP